MMPSPPRRARFQFHLSTAVVMMFVVGGLMYAQLPVLRDELGGEFFTTTSLERQPAISENEFMKREDRLVLISYRYRDYGWPVPVLSIHEVVQLDRNGQIRRILTPEKYWLGGYWFSGDVIVADALSSILILTLAFRTCEWLIRWRAARKGA